jgi:hypothetical protein
MLGRSSERSLPMRTRLFRFKRMSEKGQLPSEPPPKPPKNWGTFNPFVAQSPPELGNLGGDHQAIHTSQTSFNTLKDIHQA